MRQSVYILGAGASKDFGLPLGVEIFDCAYKLSKLKDKSGATNELATVLGDVERYMGEIFTNLPKDKMDYPPLEEILTFLWDCRNAETYDFEGKRQSSLFTHPDSAKGVFSVFTRMLGLTLSGAMELHTTGRTKVLASFIKSLLLDCRHAISFISLNYDVLLDTILAECVNDQIIDDFTYGVPLSDITQPYRGASAQQLCRKTGVVLLKPHGSLNLVWRPHRQAYYGEGFYYSKAENIVNMTNALKCPGCGRAPRPLMIPPLYNKRDYVTASARKVDLNYWRTTPEMYRMYCDRKIRQILEMADEITVIGYSLPAYDYDFKSLMMTSLMNNKNRRKLCVKLITKRDQVELKEKYEHLVGSVIIESSMGFYNYMNSRL